MKIKKLLALLLVTIPLVFPMFSFAQTKNNDVQQVLTSIEEERNKKLESELGITLPNETDNPTHMISFKDPSGKGVKLEIDGQGYKDISSPYTLPSLGIGSHLLSFKFYDKEQTSQTLEKNLVVIPRPPVVSAPEKLSKTEITLSGTALAGSTVELFLSGGTINKRGETNVDTSGNWKFTFEGDFKYAIYSVIARTKKNGFSSNLSDPSVFELDQSSRPSTTITSYKDIYFDFRSLNFKNIVPSISSNPHLLILMFICILGGGVIVALTDALTFKKQSKEAEGKFINLLNKKDGKKEEKGDKKKKKDNTNEKSMTLREKFEKAGFQREEKKDDVLTKEEFMEEYKDKDPDDSKGKEHKDKKPRKSLKDVSVTLLSKVGKKN